MTRDSPTELRTIGDHIKARRIQLRLFQTDVAKQIGVHFAFIQKWERNVGEPLPCQTSEVIRFLGYVPFEHDGSVSGRLRWLRTCAGWTQHELAFAAHCGVSSISRLESGNYDHVMTERRRHVEQTLWWRLDSLRIRDCVGSRSPRQ